MNDVPDGLDQPGLDAGYVRLDKVDETLGKNFRNAANLFNKEEAVKAHSYGNLLLGLFEA